MSLFTPPASPRRSSWEIVGIVLAFARARLELRGTRRGARIRCFGHILVPQRDGIVIGQRVTFLGGPVPTALRCARGAELVVGDRCIFNYGVEIASRHGVHVGSDCMIASLVHIRDDDGRRSGPITMGNGVWIAHAAVIEPGAVIGDEAVIATMAVVSGFVPPRSLAAGNPARWVPLDATVPPEPRSHAAARAARDGAAGARTSPDVVKAAIVEWLDDTRLFGEASRRISSDSMSLRDSGLIDSLGFVQLLLMLEKRFGVRIDRARAANAEAQSIRGLVGLVIQPATPETAGVS